MGQILPGLALALEIIRGATSAKEAASRFATGMIYDLRLPIMRQDKPVFERLRAGLHRLGHMEMMMAFVNTEGEFP